MSRRERRSAFGLLARQAATDAPLAAIVAIVVAVCAFLVSTGPGALAQVADREVRHTLEGFSAPRHDLGASAWFGFPNAGPGAAPGRQDGIEEITNTVDGVLYRLTPPLGSVLDEPEWAATATRAFATLRAEPTRPTAILIGLTATPQWRERVTFVEGTAPAPSIASGAEAVDESSREPVEVALSAAAAEQMDVGVGDILDLPATPVLVAGLYEPTDPSDGIWEHRPLLRDAAKGRAEDGRIAYTADVLLDPASTIALPQTFVSARIEAWYPLLIDAVAYDEVPRLAEQIRELSSSGVGLHSGETLLFTAGLASDLDDVTARVTLTTALLALLVAGPLGVILAVLALAAGSIADRRSTALALARARGAGGVQLRTAMMLEGALLAVPAAALGAAAAFAVTGGRAVIDDLWPVVLIAATPPLLFAIAVPGPAAPRARSSSVRWILEVLVAGLAAASLYLLFRRGIAPTRAGIDPLLAAAPLLVAAAVTIGVLRIYPWIMAATQRAAGRGKGAVGLVGSARAVRTPSLGFAAAFALIVGVSVAVFSAGMAASLTRALTLAADPATRGDIAPLDAGHPIVAAVFVFLGAAAGLPLLFCVVAIVLAVIAAARSRNRTVGCASGTRLLGRTGARTRRVGARAGRHRRHRRRSRTGRGRGARSRCRARSRRLRRREHVDTTGRGSADHRRHRGRLRRRDRPRRGDSHQRRATTES